MTTTPWEAMASQLGYATPKAMWEALYLVQKLPISDLAARFKVAHNTVRSELIRHQIQIAKQGGANFRKVHYNEELDKLITTQGATATAISMGVSYTTLLKARKRWREECKAAEATTPQEATSPSADPTSGG